MNSAFHCAIEQIENAWCGKHVLVINDVTGDKNIRGTVERISPEAPVPVIRGSRVIHCPGGAANVRRISLCGVGGRSPEHPGRMRFEVNAALAR
jgi:bifunctional ADP-heptose synthase (sugar kinase/adenylyltransferase)